MRGAGRRWPNRTRKSVETYNIDAARLLPPHYTLYGGRLCDGTRIATLQNDHLLTDEVWDLAKYIETSVIPDHWFTQASMTDSPAIVLALVYLKGMEHVDMGECYAEWLPRRYWNCLRYWEHDDTSDRGNQPDHRAFVNASFKHLPAVESTDPMQRLICVEAILNNTATEEQLESFAVPGPELWQTMRRCSTHGLSTEVVV